MEANEGALVPLEETTEFKSKQKMKQKKSCLSI